MTTYSKYPNKIDTTNELPLVTNNVTPVIAEVVNRLNNAIINIETELGVNPSGTYSTVRDRLDALTGSTGNGSVQIQNNSTVVVSQATIIDFIGNVIVTNPSPLKAQIEIIGGQATQVQETKSVTTNGQTAFTLSSTPIENDGVLMYVNGLKQTYSSDYLVTGSAILYTGSVSLTTSDIVEFYYLIDLGSSGTGSITLKEDAVTISSSVTTINFTGNANLTDNGSGQVTVDIPSSGSSSLLSVIAGETISAGQPLYIANDSGNPRAFALTWGAFPVQYAIGIASNSGSTGATINVTVAGEVSIPDAIWDSVPAATNVGEIVYVKDTGPNLSLSPTSPTAVVIGILTAGGSGNCKITIQTIYLSGF